MKFRPIDTTGACVAYNGQGTPYEELTCLYPTLGKAYLPFEAYYDPVPVRDWMRENAWFPVLVVALYGAMIVGGKAYFETRKPWNWRRALAVWNLGLAVFSFMGFARMGPHLLHNLMHYSWREYFCMNPQSTAGSGSTGLWGQLFVLSKLPELFDTLFIIVHKKKLIFLHWFHHVSVFYVVWHGYINDPTMGIFVCVMNFGVHAIMYFYYFLMAIQAKPAWFKPQWITAAQISQMVVGVVLTPVLFYLYYIEQIPGCSVHRETVHSMFFLYGAFLFLFLQFFFRRYFVASFKQKAL